MFTGVPAQDARLTALVQKGRLRKARKEMTAYSVNTAQKQFQTWVKLEEFLLVKFMDGNVKPHKEDGSFKHSKYGESRPTLIDHPEYTETWKQAVAESEHGKVLQMP